jgi:hypothetical protein
MPAGLLIVKVGRRNSDHGSVRKIRFLSIVFMISTLGPAFAAPPDLSVGPEDMRIEVLGDGGYHLYIRAKGGIASVLLTDTTKDPAKKVDNFAYRAKDHNPINGDEMRLLNGKPIPPESKIYSLVSSTVASDQVLGKSFHVFIPYVVLYGYPWSRHGETAVGNGTFINIRAFEKPYADYTGAFADNPFMMKVAEIPKPPPGLPPGKYSPAADEKFTEVAKKVEHAEDTVDTSAKIADLVDGAAGESLDLVIVLDVTESMDKYMPGVKKELAPLVKERVSRFKTFRIGMVIFRDYFPDEFITRKIDFTTDFDDFNRRLQGVRAMGGGDIPEAVHEGLYAAETEFEWKADKRLIILVGDAPPNPVPKGKITEEDVLNAAEALNIEIDAIVEPLDPTIK